jgi:serine/threonine protein kinase
VRLATRLTDSAPVVAKFIHSSNVWHWNREGENQKTPLEISMMKIFSDIKLKNVIHYIEHYQVGERFIIIMEYLGDDWIDLYDFIELHGPVEESVATHIFKEVCETIQTMHSLGYSHNDIKGLKISV